MAKLYWRIKRDGKWTWTAATPENTKWHKTYPKMAFFTGQLEYSNDSMEIVEKPEVYTDGES